MDTLKILHPALMTSSSLRDYGDLFGEIAAVSGVNWFDLLILRDMDLDRMNLENASQKGRMAEIVAENYKQIKDWIFSETENCEITISAFATYFPDITSAVDSRRENAIQAVANTIRLAIDLHRARPKQMPHAIVEIVCGTILDQAAQHDAERISVYGGERKLDLLCESLLQIRELVTPECEGGTRFAIALEMEPGETYVLNSLTKMQGLAARLDGTHERSGSRYCALKNCVGFNLDIAHLRIAGIRGDDLDERLAHKIVHAHIFRPPFSNPRRRPENRDIRHAHPRSVCGKLDERSRAERRVSALLAPTDAARAD